MVRAGFGLAARVLSFPAPVLAACTGHTVAMGSFLLLSSDYRVGAGGPYKIMLNEVALGIALPQVAVEICRQRLTPAYFTRAAILAEVFKPGDAVAAGFLDRVVPAAELADAASGTAAELARLDLGAHTATKFRVREDALARIQADRKSTRLNSSHVRISYAVFCLKKKKKTTYIPALTINRKNKNKN